MEDYSWITILLYFFITMAGYLFFPILYNILNPNCTNNEAKKVAIINSIIVFIIFKFIIIIFNTNTNNIFNVAPACIYGYIAYWLMAKSEHNNSIKYENNSPDNTTMNILINNYKKIKCRVCDNEVLEKDSINGVCLECHKEILKRLEEKNESK